MSKRRQRHTDQRDNVEITCMDSEQVMPARVKARGEQIQGQVSLCKKRVASQVRPRPMLFLRVLAGERSTREIYSKPFPIV